MLAAAGVNARLVDLSGWRDENDDARRTDQEAHCDVDFATECHRHRLCAMHRRADAEVRPRLFRGDFSRLAA
jgi:hypothetical protein